VHRQSVLSLAASLRSRDADDTTEAVADEKVSDDPSFPGCLSACLHHCLYHKQCWKPIGSNLSAVTIENSFRTPPPPPEHIYRLLLGKAPLQLTFWACLGFGRWLC
jgi:hypothetical protein